MNLFRRGIETQGKGPRANSIFYTKKKDILTKRTRRRCIWTGRLGDCYEQTGKVEKARQTYKKRFSMGRISSTYYSLISIFVLAGQFDRAFEVAEMAEKGAQHISGIAQEYLLRFHRTWFVQNVTPKQSNCLTGHALFSEKELPDYYSADTSLMGMCMSSKRKLMRRCISMLRLFPGGSVDTFTSIVI